MKVAIILARHYEEFDFENNYVDADGEIGTFVLGVFPSREGRSRAKAYFNNFTMTEETGAIAAVEVYFGELGTEDFSLDFRIDDNGKEWKRKK